MNTTAHAALAILPVPTLGTEFADSFQRLAEQYTGPTHGFSEVAEWVLALHDAGWIDDSTLSRMSDDRDGIAAMVAARDEALTRLNTQAAAQARAMFAKLGYDVSNETTTFLDAKATCGYESLLTVEISACAGLHFGSIGRFASTADPTSAKLSTAMLQCVVSDCDLLIDQAEVVAQEFSAMREDLIDELMQESWRPLFDHYEAQGWPEQEVAFKALMDANADEYDELSRDEQVELRDHLTTLLGEVYEQRGLESAVWSADELGAMTPQCLSAIASGVEQESPRAARFKALAQMVAAVVERTPMNGLCLRCSGGAAPILLASTNACEDVIHEYSDCLHQGDELPAVVIECEADEATPAYIERLSRVLVAAHARGLMMEVLAEHGMFDAVEDEDESHEAGYGTDRERIAA